MYFFLMYIFLHCQWYFLVTKFMALLASFLLKIWFVFSNTLSIFKVMFRNRNLTKFDMLTSSSSNRTAQTLLNNEYLKKEKKLCFYLHFANSNFIVIFSYFIFNIKNKLSHIWNLHKIYVLNKFLYIHDSLKSCQK